MQAADALAPSRLPTTDQDYRHSVPSPPSPVTAESPNPDKPATPASLLLPGALATIQTDMHDEWIGDNPRHLSERSMAKFYETSDNGTVAAIEQQVVTEHHLKAHWNRISSE